MADLPLEPTLARMLLAAGEMGCTAEVLTVVAMLSVQSVWAGGGRREVDEAKARWGAHGVPLLSSCSCFPPGGGCSQAAAARPPVPDAPS